MLERDLVNIRVRLFPIPSNGHIGTETSLNLDLDKVLAVSTPGRDGQYSIYLPGLELKVSDSDLMHGSFIDMWQNGGNG